MARRSGTVARLAGSPAIAREERDGLPSLMEELYPQMEIAGLREGHDDPIANTETLQLLEQHPHLGGIYNIGGASDGVARALKQAGRDQKVVFVGHGLTPDTRALLVDGTLDAVITQSPQTIVLNAVQVFSNLRRGRDPLSGIDAVRLSIVLRENLPDVLSGPSWRIRVERVRIFIDCVPLARDNCRRRVIREVVTSIRCPRSAAESGFPWDEIAWRSRSRRRHLNQFRHGYAGIGLVLRYGCDGEHASMKSDSGFAGIADQAPELKMDPSQFLQAMDRRAQPPQLARRERRWRNGRCSTQRSRQTMRLRFWGTGVDRHSRAGHEPLRRQYLLRGADDCQRRPSDSDCGTGASGLAAK